MIKIVFKVTDHESHPYTVKLSVVAGCREQIRNHHLSDMDSVRAFIDGVKETALITKQEYEERP